MTALKVIRRTEPEVAPAPEPAPARVEETAEWYLAVMGEQYGPMSHAELCNRIRRGEASHEALVWREGFEDWLEVHRVPELPRVPPPAPAHTARPEPSPAPSPELTPVHQPVPEPEPEPEPVPQPGPVPDAHMGQTSTVHPRVPLLNWLSAAGGLTAGLCGLALVAHVMIRDEQPTVRTVIEMVETEAAVEKKEKARPVTVLPGLVLTLPAERKTAPRKRRRRAPPRDKGNLTRLAPPPQLPAPPELVLPPIRGETTPAVDLSAVVARHQRTNRKRMSSCYERAAKKDSAMETVKAHLSLEIGRSGIVRVATVRAAGNAYLQRCLSAIVRRWTFPAGEAQELTFNVLFKGTGR